VWAVNGEPHRLWPASYPLPGVRANSPQQSLPRDAPAGERTPQVQDLPGFVRARRL